MKDLEFLHKGYFTAMLETVQKKGATPPGPFADDGSLKTWRKDCRLWPQQLILRYQRSRMVGDCL